MFCWSCGKPLTEGMARCGSCGTAIGAAVTSARSGDIGAGVVPQVKVSMCPACGYLGEGMPYFRRSSHSALLVGATLLSYGIGGLVYWLVKRRSLVCPSCGLGWDRARLLDMSAFLGKLQSGPSLSRDVGRTQPEALPRGGLFRRALGAVLGILALYLLALGVLGASAEALVTSVFMGIAGALSFAWGWKALQERRAGLLRSLQTRVLHVAAARGGQITATDVAADLEVTLAAAERVLFSLDDGFRVCSDVTDEGLLIFDFPEIRARGLSAGTASYAGLPSMSSEDV